MQPDLVFSLGCFCRTAWNLRAHFGVQQAYPFDWWITPARAMLRMMEPGFRFGIAAEDLTLVPPGQANEDSVYAHRLNILFHHDFPRGQDGRVLPITPEAVARVNAKYATRFGRLHRDLAAARAPLAVIGQPHPGWPADPALRPCTEAALNGPIEPAELVRAVRERLGARLRVLVIGFGNERTEEVEGGLVVIRPKPAGRQRTPGVPPWAEPAAVFRAGFAALGAEPRAA